MISPIILLEVQPRTSEPPSDAAVRARAIDTTKSFLVQAPAGSGKTELLTNRFLALLSIVEEPEHVLAITFARGATAEMRNRVIEKLQQADAGEANAAGRDDCTHQLALAALRQSRKLGWQLLEQPQRLNIQTIDSYCLSIAHRTPLLARLGGTLQPTENATPLYNLAAERTLQRLGGSDSDLNSALEGMLTLRDNNRADCQRLLAEMLKMRDQWAHLFLLSGDVNWEEVRKNLEKPFQDEIKRVLGKAHELLSTDPTKAAELVALVKYASLNPDTKRDISLFNTLEELPDPSASFVEHWRCLPPILLTGTGVWRKSFDLNVGFPPRSKNNPLFDCSAKSRMTSLSADLAAIPELLETLCQVRDLPTPQYSDEQWQALRQVFTTLRQAVAELKVIFAEQNIVDFIEVGLAAEMVLRSPEETLGSADTPLEQALGLGDRVRHLLVDEFQDTSRRQFQLLTSLLRGWDSCDGRTCFLVGDPMQSIYLFRQAEVELFHRVSRHGLNCDDNVIDMETLKLETNFRSHSGLVKPLNKLFAAVFGEATSGVQFTPSVAHQATSKTAVHVHADFLSSPSSPADKHSTRQRETEKVLSIVDGHLPQIEQAKRTPSTRYTIGILVRVKKHAASIAVALRRKNIAFRAVELEALRERQEILDLVALTRALTHPMDRVAWLSVLRAPWCGLHLADLYALAGTDIRETSYTPILQLLTSRIGLLSDDGKRRATATRDVLVEALDSRNRLSASMSLASWVERTWYGLEGHRCVDRTALENVQVFFSMLDGLDSSGSLLSGEAMETQLARLFAQPNPEADEHAGIQIMTIHKAKGLGFDVVIVPGLERGAGSDRPTLVCWLERAASPAIGPRPEEEVLVAPIGEKGDQTSRIYKWVQIQRKRREIEERKRLLYVASTRASQELHLLGTATEKGSELRPGEPSSMLATAWPALKIEFEEARTRTGEEVLHRTAGAPDNLLVLVDRHQDAGADDLSGAIDIAAAAESTGPAGLTLRRLPPNIRAELIGDNVTTAAANAPVIETDQDAIEGLFSRPEGSLAARALGITVHALFESAARLMERGTSVSELKSSIPNWRTRALSLLRNNGVVATAPAGGQATRGQRKSLSQAETLVDRAIDALNAAISHREGLWILSPHKAAQSETSWTGYLDGNLRTLRVDRLFQAGNEPLEEGKEYLWILDYKTASRPESLADEFIKAERGKYEKQLEMYGRMLRFAKGSSLELRLALYYPLLQRLDYWSM